MARQKCKVPGCKSTASAADGYCNGCREHFEGLERDVYADGDYDDDEPSEDCERCGGDGHIEYNDAGPDVWGEDCPSEKNHLVTCPDCNGTGVQR